jgi:hypothetical protein
LGFWVNLPNVGIAFGGASRLVQPILQRKQHALDLQDLEGLLHIHIQIKDFKLFSSFYTRIDQVFILWGVIAAVIFSTAQFLTVSWANQAIFSDREPIEFSSTLGTDRFVISLNIFWLKLTQNTSSAVDKFACTLDNN